MGRPSGPSEVGTAGLSGSTGLEVGRAGAWGDLADVGRAEVGLGTRAGIDAATSSWAFGAASSRGEDGVSSLGSDGLKFLTRTRAHTVWALGCCPYPKGLHRPAGWPLLRSKREANPGHYLLDPHGGGGGGLFGALASPGRPTCPHQKNSPPAKNEIY